MSISLDTVVYPIVEESHKRAAKRRDTPASDPRDVCVHQLFEAQAERTPRRVAVACDDQQLTYGELNCRANRLAHQLRAAGVGAETLVGLYIERSIEMVVGLLGILKSGGAYVPLDPSYPKDRIAFMIEDAGLKAIVCGIDIASEVADRGVLPLCVESCRVPLAEAENDNPVVTMRPDNLAYVIYTSGSTGKPKGVQIEHGSVVNFLLSMRERPGLSEDDTLLSVTTMSFDIAALEIFLPLVVGAKTVIASREKASDGRQLLNELESSEATVLQATPATWRLLIGAGWKGDRRLRLLCGGEALPADLAEKLLERGGSLWNMYGPTETTIWSAVHEVRASDSRILIGKPIANTQVYVLDDDLRPAPPGEVGELYIGGEGLARGYLNRPELTEQRFIRDPFSGVPGARLYRTGDLGRALPDGNLECLGRIDQQVKIRGFRIEPGEIEAIISRHPGVRESVVIAREYAPGDARLVAYYVPDERLAPARALIAELRRELVAALPDYMVPSTFVAIGELPLTPNGKVDRKALPVPESIPQSRREPFLGPRDPLEHQLVRIWEEALGVQPVGVRDNFFELGGHSLLGARVMTEIEKSCGVRLPLDTLYRGATVEHLAEVLLRQEGESWQSPVIPIQPRGSRLPFFFLHGDFSGGGFYCLNLARRLGDDQPFYALPPHGTDSGRIPPTIEEMAASRLESLRGVQPQGPYLLGGFCNGALVAYEMARLLEAQGERVALLALVYASAANVRFKLISKVAGAYGRLARKTPEQIRGNFLRTRSRVVQLEAIKRYYASRLGELWRAGASEQVKVARRSTKALYKKLTAVVAPAADARALESFAQQTEPSETLQDSSSAYRRIIRWDITDAYHQIMDSYIPGTYGGRVTLLWPAEAPVADPHDPTMGWSKVAAGGVDVRPIAGKHLTCITKYADTLADQLSQCLQSASPTLL